MTWERTGSDDVQLAPASTHEVTEVRPATTLSRGEYPWPAWGVVGAGGAGVALATAYVVWRHWPRHKARSR